MYANFQSCLSTFKRVQTSVSQLMDEPSYVYINTHIERTCKRSHRRLLKHFIHILLCFDHM